MVEALRQLVPLLTVGAKRNKLSLPPIYAVLAWIGVGVVLLPLLPGLVDTLAPALSTTVWLSLVGNNQIPAALSVTLFSAISSTLLALLLACGIMMLCYPGKMWQRLRLQLPLLLAFPHAAFAIGLAFLLVPSGWLARLLAGMLDWGAPPQWVTTQDPYGVSLTLVLALKESWFLLWILVGLLGEQQLKRQMTQAQSMGYSHYQIWWQVLLPQILPKLGWPLLAVFAYSLSVVDMALILGPSTPPTLAVLGWQWFSDPQPAQQALASAVALLLMALLFFGALAGRLGLMLFRYRLRNPAGRRHPERRLRFLSSVVWLTLVPGWLALMMLVVWSFAGGWFFPALWPQSFSLQSWLNADYSALWTTLWLGGGSVFIALPLSLLWLEWGPRQQKWIYFPLILPALPLAAAQYQVLLLVNLDNSGAGVIWSHLTWVLPYMILVLSGAYRAFDDRYLLTGQALGYSRWMSCLCIKWPMLLRPILSALAVGFAVSVAQYLPTLFAGGGRFETVTTEAVALSAGGNRRTLAVQALLQALLPMLVFALSSLVFMVWQRNRQGLK